MDTSMAFLVSIATICFCGLLQPVSSRVGIPDIDIYMREPGPLPEIVPAHRLREARQLPGSSNNYTTEFPSWANYTLLLHGQKVLRENFAGFEYASALTTLLMSVDTQRVLISGGNTTDIAKATKRYLVNVLNFWFWAIADLNNPEELFESLNLLQAVHAKVGHNAHLKSKGFAKPLIATPPLGTNPPIATNKHKLQTRIWDAFEADLHGSKKLRALTRGKDIFPPRNGGTAYPLNQFAMATQLFAFTALPIIDPARTLMPGVPDEDLYAYMHYWAFLGRGLGIRDEYNVCLQKDVASARKYFNTLLVDYFVTGLMELTYEHKAVMEVALKAAGRILGYDDLTVILNRVCKDVLVINCPRTRRMMPALGRAANLLLERVAQPISEIAIAKRAANFLVNGMIQVETLKHYNFNPIFPRNFTGGIMELNREILRTSDVHWKFGDPEIDNIVLRK